MTDSGGMSLATFSLQRASLTLYWPDGSTEKVVLRFDSVTVGCVPDADIVIPSEVGTFAPRQVSIDPDAAGYRVSNLTGASCVWLNGKSLDVDALLSDGDELVVGERLDGPVLRVVYAAGTLAQFDHLSQAVGTSVHEMPQGILATAPANSPYLHIRWVDGRDVYYELPPDGATFGRADDTQFTFPLTMSYISNYHFRIELAPEGHYRIIDLNSTNGTRLNGQLLSPHTPVPLPDGDIIRVGDDHLAITVSLTFENPLQERLPYEGFTRTLVDAPSPARRERILIGRTDDCHIQLDSPSVSRHHALIEQQNGAFRLVDLDSTNGTQVNGQTVLTTVLQEGDIIEVGSHRLLFKAEEVIPFESHGMRLDVIDLSRTVKTRQGPLTILDRVDMTVMPREFIAIVGGSGAGKTTLMKALIGLQPGDGHVRLNGHDFYREYDRFRAEIGYVPQHDILHTTLTVQQALEFAGKLRLPSDVSAAERADRITRALQTVEMDTEHLRTTRIGKLSGGQRKRVSIAAELLADPKLIFLDEATSGLDPGLEKKMMHTLRRMADEGRTVVLITHATANIVQTDHVAFISQGKLVYFGPPRDSLEFFGVEDFADIYGRIDRRGEEWRQVYEREKPATYQQYVEKRQASQPASMEGGSRPRRLGLVGLLRQLGVLLARNMRVLASDPVTLGLLLALFPVTALLQLVISTPHILVGDPAIVVDPAAAAKTLTESYLPIAKLNTFVFVMGLEAVLVGMYVPSNELIRERPIFRRERMVNLRIAPYLLSKVAMFVLFAAVQVIAYLLLLSLRVEMPMQGVYLPGPIEFFVTLFLTMIAGVGIGLVVSALSRTTEMATYMLVMAMFFQFFFAGTVFDLRGNPAEPLSYLTGTRWALTGLGITIDTVDLAEDTIICTELPEGNPLAAQVGQTFCLNYPDAKDDLLIPYPDTLLLPTWGILMGMTLVTLLTTGFLIRRLDAAR